jgi:hypothetical protein
MQSENQKQPVSRKKFMIWGLGVLSAFSAAGLLFRSGSGKKTKTVKMLTQDGKLVEVEVSKLSSKRKKIKDEQIFTWVKRKSSKI